jgi:iron complex outermembrane receptor protein
MKKIKLMGRISAIALAMNGGISLAQSQDTGIEEVTVTAERRVGSLQKSSLALQVLSSDELEKKGILGPKDLMQEVPGLAIGTGGPEPQVYIRGIGDLSAISLSNPAVATNIDGVYIARPAATNAGFFDLARVEVLKGPQGTLYGRNASGGALNLITNQPNLDSLGGHVNLELGNYSDVNADGALNIPLSSSLAVRGAFQVVNRQGYLTDKLDDDKHEAGRLQALWKPSDDMSLLVAADYGHMGGKGAGFVYLPSPGNNPWEGITSPASNSYLARAIAAAGLCVPVSAFPPPATAKSSAGACPGLTVAPGVTLPQIGLFNPLDGGLAYQNNMLFGVHSQFDWNLGFATLTLLPAFRYTDEQYTTFPAYPFFQHPAVSDETTLEARLSNDNGPLKWVAGLYFFNENQRYTSGVAAGLVQNVTFHVAPHTESYAAFGQGTYSLADDLRLIGGLRYTEDDRNIRGETYSIFPAVSRNPAALCLNPSVAACLTESYQGDHSFYSLSWKAGIEHDLTPQSMAYATVSTGFKAGGLDQNVAPSPAGTNQAQVYYPEKLLAYEAGVRNRFLDNHLQVNLEGFLWVYRDHQEPHVLIDGEGNAAFGFVNAGKATLYGLDPDITFKVTEADTLHLVAEWIQSRYNSFNYQSAFPVATSCAETGATGAFTIDCSGKQLAHVSKWSGNIGYDHRFQLPQDASLVFSVDAQFASAKWLQIEFSPAERAPGYVTEDASLAYYPPSGNWSLTGYVRNIANKAIYSSGNANAFGPQTFAAAIGSPRTFGARLHYEF